MNVIDISHISKKYTLKEKQYYYTLRDSISTLFQNPVASVKKSLLAENEFWALDDVSFSVAEGEIVGLIGQNGAGKSTLLKILSRITPPTQGSITIRGRIGSLLEVGTGFHPELSGRENIYLNGAILGMRRAEVNDIFDDIVEFAEVSRFLDTPMKHYSSGMYMRLAFSVASHLLSEILLVDEVLAVGDAQFQKKCLGKMELIAKEGRTIIFVSHNLGVMQQLCERSVWLQTGKVKMTGPTQKVISKYITSSEKASTLPLKTRPRTHEASLRAKIIGLTLSQADEKNTHLIRSDEPCRIRLSIEAQEDLHTGVWIAVKDDTGHTVFLFSSGHLQSREFAFPKGKSSVECLIQPMHLTTGRYSLECGLLYPQREIVDLIPDAGFFTVESVDPYHVNFDFSSRFASVFVDHTWKVE